jgi:putative transposase
LGGKRGQLITLTDRQEHVELINQAIISGARQDKACDVIGLSARTLQRWQANGVVGEDKRPTATRPAPINKLSNDERQAVMAVCNVEEFSSLPPS